jgi:hypothetical protein
LNSPELANPASGSPAPRAMAEPTATVPAVPLASAAEATLGSAPATTLTTLQAAPRDAGAAIKPIERPATPARELPTSATPASRPKAPGDVGLTDFGGRR